MPNRQTCAITRLDTVDSVLTYARAMAQKGAFGLWESVTAERQTAGRGQYGRVWESPAGNIYAALRLPQTPPFNGTAAAAAVSAVVAAVLCDNGWDVRIKWPNDIVVRCRARWCKAGGILLEAKGDVLIAGIGINVTAAPDSTLLREGAALPAASLAEAREDARPLSAQELWEQMALRFASLPEDFSRCWRSFVRARLLWQGECVTLTLSDGRRIEGVLADIGPDGELILAGDGGCTQWLEGALTKCD